MDGEHNTYPAKAVTSDANVWRQEYQIRSYEVDCCNRLSILAIFAFMQEAASQHAEALGVSIHQLISENYTWLLSRLKIRISSFPSWNDQVRVCTWPSGVQQLFALRDFELKDANDRSIAAALSAWLIIDLQKRRPVRIAPFVERLNPIEGCHILDDRLDKLPALRDDSHQKSFEVRHSDLDINQHANNVKFVEWLIEGIPDAILKTMVPVEFEINFLAEAFHNDRILANCAPQNSDDSEYLHSLTRQQDGRRELARARTKWRKIE